MGDGGWGEFEKNFEGEGAHADNGDAGIREIKKGGPKKACGCVMGRRLVGARTSGKAS